MMDAILPGPAPIPAPMPSGRTRASPDARDAALRKAAAAIETQFLSEMLKGAGFESARKSFGGGIGEEQFSSFLRDAESRAIVEHGGLGLSESLFRALKERGDAASG